MLRTDYFNSTYEIIIFLTYKVGTKKLEYFPKVRPNRHCTQPLWTLNCIFLVMFIQIWIVVSYRVSFKDRTIV